uniref:FHOD1 N-terminal GTPase-binding domain-containing protein n=1 Tax=Crocodylus porosus TaxID=8502 RepID=A0A7M4FAM2_CROPO
HPGGKDRTARSRRLVHGRSMATLLCRVQFLDDTDPFTSTSFPEPTRPPLYAFREDLPLSTQLPAVHRLLRAPHKLDDCTLQLSHNGTYLDLESTLTEQRDELEGFQEDMECVIQHYRYSLWETTLVTTLSTIITAIYLLPILYSLRTQNLSYNQL